MSVMPATSRLHHFHLRATIIRETLRELVLMDFGDLVVPSGQQIKLLVRQPLDINEFIPGVIDSQNQLIQFQVNGFRFAILGVLNQVVPYSNIAPASSVSLCGLHFAWHLKSD